VLQTINAILFCGEIFESVVVFELTRVKRGVEAESAETLESEDTPRL
jgi:hypothetical protein